MCRASFLGQGLNTQSSTSSILETELSSRTPHHQKVLIVSCSSGRSSPAALLIGGIGRGLPWAKGLSQRLLFPVYRIPFFVDYTKVPSLGAALQRQGKYISPLSPSPSFLGLEKGEGFFQGHVMGHESALQTEPAHLGLAASAHIHSMPLPHPCLIAGHFRPRISDSWHLGHLFPQLPLRFSSLPHGRYPADPTIPDETAEEAACG